MANERDGLSLSITEQGVIGKILRHIAFKHADTSPPRYHPPPRLCRAAASGAYLCRLEAGGERDSKKMILAR